MLHSYPQSDSGCFQESIIKTSTSNSLKCSPFKFGLFLLSHYCELMVGGGQYMKRRNASCCPVLGIMCYESVMGNESNGVLSPHSLLWGRKGTTHLPNSLTYCGWITVEKATGSGVRTEHYVLALSGRVLSLSKPSFPHM